MFLFLAVDANGSVKWSLWFELFIILGAMFSPRVTLQVDYIWNSPCFGPKRLHFMKV